MKTVQINDGGRISAMNCAKRQSKMQRQNLSVHRSGRMRLLAVAACAAAGMASSRALAASGTWNGLTSANWGDANWTTTPVPGIGDTATFNGGGNGNTTVSLGTGVTIQNIVFDTSNAAAYTIGAGAVNNQTLNLNDSGGILVNSTVTNSQLFNAGIVLGTDSTTQNDTIANNSLNSTLTFAGNFSGGPAVGTAGTETLTVTGAGKTVIGGSLLLGNSSNIALTKLGSGTLTFNGTTNAALLGSGVAGGAFGLVTVNAGTLALDYSNFAAVGNANLLNSYSTVALGGGTLQIIGNAANPSTQSFNGSNGSALSTSDVVANYGLNTISVSNNATLNLGGYNQTTGSQTVFVGPATINGSGALAATGTITTNFIGDGANNQTANAVTATNKGLYWNNTTRNAIATVGLYDWASTDTTAGATPTSAPYTIIGGSQVAGFYTPEAGATGVVGADKNFDISGNVTLANAKPWYGDTIRFNASGAASVTTGAGGTGYSAELGGVLVTPNVGANNVSLNNGGAWIQGTATNASIDIYQNNTAGELLISAPIYNPVNYVQGGPGTVNLTGQTTLGGFTNSAYLNGGYTVIGINNQIGASATKAMLYLNGGTLVSYNSGNATIALDNGGSSSARPITLGANGGGLAAVAGTTLVVDGVITSAAYAGPLIIGIPASSANGNVAGLLPGTGAGTANTTGVYGSGTVVLNYAFNTSGNSQYSPTQIVGGATLRINSQYDLGGANAGSLTFNNGTLQYSQTLATGAAGTATDISGQGVIFAGNGTIDTYGHNVTYASPIGGGGSGGFTLTDSTTLAASRGSLTLSGSNTYTGPTTVAAGTLILSAGASLASSAVTVNSGTSLLAKAGSNAGPGVLTLSSGSSLSMIDNTIGTLTAGGLTTSANTVLNYEFSGATNDQIATTLSGGLTINGGTFNLSSASSSGLPMTTDGTYNLISYAGADSIAGGSSALNTDLSVGNPVYGLHYSFNDTGSGSGGIIQLIVTGTAATSSGWILDASTGSWATAGNWSSSAIPNSVGSAASFAGAAATHTHLARTVTLDGNETVGTAFFDSPNGESYTINQGTGGSLIFNTGSSSTAIITVNAGSHTINAPVTLSSSVDITTTGTGSLAMMGNIGNGTGTNTVTKDGTGTLILGGSNTYGPGAGTIGTTINSGTVQIASNGAFSTGDVSITAPVNPVTLQLGASSLTVGNNINIASGVTVTLDTQNAGSAVFSGTISGSGSGITEIGTGSVTITGLNTYSGNTNISSGTLQLGNGGTNGYVSGNIIDNSALVLDRTDNYTLSNTISGTGTLTQIGTDNVTLNAANTFSGNTVIASGILTTGNALALQNSALNYNNQGGTLSFGTLTAATIGGLIGTQNLALANTTPAAVALTLGGSGTNLYTGTLSGGGSLALTATGTQTIGSGTTGGATYTGGTTVNAGTLVLGGVTNITGGTIALTGLNGVSNLTVADSAQVTSTSTLYLEDLPLNQGSTQYYPGASNLVVKGGSQLTVAALSIGVPTGTRVASSTVTVQDTAALTVNGSFNLESTAGSTASTNVVNLNGGTLATQNFVFSGGGGGSGTYQIANVQFNGGVLKPLASDSSTALFVPNTTGINTLVQAGGAIINTNSFNDTIATPLVHGGGATADGGLTKTGAGVLTLTANATYNGPTVINAGTLRLGVGAAATLVAGYSFDNTTATPVTSSPTTIYNTVPGSSASLNGTVVVGQNGPSIVAGGPKINGVSGNALQFVNDGSAVVIPSGIENLSGGGSWTVSAWIQTSQQQGATILSKNTGTGIGGSWAAGNTIFYLSNGTGGTAANLGGASAAGYIPTIGRVNAGYEAAAVNANVADGNWHMVTYVDNAGTKSIYIDGVLSALSQNGIGTAADVGNQVQLGYTADSNPNDGSQFLQGSLDDINFFSGALTATQIQNLMASNSISAGGNPNSGVNTLLPTTTVSIPVAGGSLDVDGSTQTIASLSGVAGSTVTLGGGQFTVGNATNTTFAGSITDTGSASNYSGGSLVKVGTGTLTLSGSNSYSGNTSVTAGTLQLASANAFPTNTGLTVSSGASVTIANHSTNATSVPVLSSLTNSGTIDLVNNALVVHSGAIAAITAEAQLAYNNGAWNGTNASAGVITSSLASADPTHLTAVGVATGLSGTFEGVSITSSDVLVKYTYYGDANLDGVVDGTDYSRIDSTYLSEKTTSTNISGWYNGDFNYDGVVDGSDYTLMDNAYNSQSGRIAAEIATPTSEISGAAGTSSVPEPASLTLLGIGAGGLLGRRRRR